MPKLIMILLLSLLSVNSFAATKEQVQNFMNPILGKHSLSGDPACSEIQIIDTSHQFVQFSYTGIFTDAGGKKQGEIELANQYYIEKVSSNSLKMVHNDSLFPYKTTISIQKDDEGKLESITIKKRAGTILTGYSNVNLECRIDN